MSRRSFEDMSSESFGLMDPLENPSSVKLRSLHYLAFVSMLAAKIRERPSRLLDEQVF